jgi:glycosyltransferase involved in cell wall biosynthesis
MCAGSFRATPLAEALARLAPSGSQIDVVTTEPNRYHLFAAETRNAESSAGMTIVRIPLPKHQSGMLDQSRAFTVYARAVRNYVAKRQYDLVFATSSRLMTAVLGAWVASRKGARLYLDLRDIFADAIQDVLPHSTGTVVKPIFSALEAFALRRADKVNLVSAGFSDYFSARYPRQRFAFFTNGVDDEFVAASAQPSRGCGRRDHTLPLTVVYAGNIGEGQALHAIVPALAERLRGRVRFRIIGDGGRRGVLESALKKTTASVELLPPVNRDRLLDAYREADVLFLHLNDCEAFRKVLPSKIFEYAALGKPVWAGVSGFAAEFIKAEIANAVAFEPCNVDDGVRSFESLAIMDTPRPDFVSRYARANISRRMALDIIDTAGGS